MAIREKLENKFDRTQSDASTEATAPYYDFTSAVPFNNMVRLNRYSNRKYRAYDNGLSEGGVKMDDSTKLLLDRMDRDMREHKQEIRDRDARLQSEMQEREKRVHEESKEREQRIISAIGDIKNEVTSMKAELSQNVSSIKQDVSDNTKHVQNLVRQNFWGNITTILAILGICATIAFTVWAAINSGNGASGGNPIGNSSTTQKAPTSGK